MANTQNNPLKLDADFLLQQLNLFVDQAQIKSWCLAYSGGVDSQVLLHLLHLSNVNFFAVYVDHGLQAESNDWAKHCAQQCDSLNIPFNVIKVNALPNKGESPEAAARKARYNGLIPFIKQHVGLLTAQHQDDQSETVLLQLLRGAGAAGLSAMPEVSLFSQGIHARPLLKITQKQILDYATQNNLDWIEDPSNNKIDYDRNYLRHQIVPKIKQRWPAINKTLSIFAQQQVENVELLNSLASLDLQFIKEENDCLNVPQLNKFDEARIRNILRFWLKTLNKSMPSRMVLEQIVQQIKNESHDSHILITWAKVEVRRFRNKLYCLNKLNHDTKQKLNWDMKNNLRIESIEKTLSCKKFDTEDSNIKFYLKMDVLNKSVIVKFRQGGEKIKPAGRDSTHDLKSLFQEANIPAWQRDRIPLLYINNELVCIVGLVIADAYSSQTDGIYPQC